MSKKTANYFRLQQFVNDRFDELENDHFSKWIFIKHKPVNVKYLNGKNISYSGVGFDGNPMQVFWSKNYIPKYIEDFCFKGVEAALENSNKFKISPNTCLDEFKMVLHAEIGKTFGKMADIDSKLRGDGINIPPKRSVTADIEELKNKTDQIIESHKSTNLGLVLFWAKAHPLPTIIAFIAVIIKPSLEIIKLLVGMS